MHKYVLDLCLCVALLLTGCNGTQSDTTTNPTPIEVESSAASEVVQQNSESVANSAAEQESRSDSVTISFDFKRGGTPASNQFAVWLEDDEGNLVKTLVATNFTANGGYKTREDSIPTWVAKANSADMTADEVDAVSGATPQAGELAYTWDGTDMTGEKVPAGTYHFYLEGTLYWSSRVLYTGSFTLGSESQDDIQVTANYTENTEQNRDMIQNVKAEYRSSSNSDGEVSSDTAEQKLLGGMTPEDALEYMKTTPNLVIVQVNTAEWKIDSGFTGALWIPHDEMAERYDEIPMGCPVILHCGAGVVSVPAYETLMEKRPDIPELSYIAGSPRSIMEQYNEWLKTNTNQ